MFEKLSREADSRLRLACGYALCRQSRRRWLQARLKKHYWRRLAKSCPNLRIWNCLGQSSWKWRRQRIFMPKAFGKKGASIRFHGLPLAELADAAATLMGEKGVHAKWKSTADAVEWFTSRGWHLDSVGQRPTSAQDQAATGALRQVRARLERAYLRQLDEVNGAFSELLAHGGTEDLGLRFAGEPSNEMSTKRPGCRSRVGRVQV